MADAVKAVGKDVQQKATDELVDLQPHDLALPAEAIVLIGEGDVLIGDLDEPRVGDRRAMGVAREIAENLLGPAEGRLGVDDPVDLVAARRGAGRTPAAARGAASPLQNCSSPRRKAASSQRS